MNVRAVDWFYVQNGRQIGPVPVKQFDDLVRSGRITLETLVWREGLVNWQPFGSISATPSSLPTPPAPPPPPGAPPPMLPGALTACAECGFAFPQSEMIPFASSWICAKCKPIFFQRVREGAPLAAGGAEAWQSGDAVVTLIGGALPVRCVKCNGAVTGQHLPRTLYWHSEWVYILLLSPLIYLIVSMSVRKSARVSVPICEEHRQRRRIAIGVSWLLVAIGIGSLIAAIAIESGVLGIISVVGFIAAVILGLWKGTLVSAKKIDAQHVWVRGFCKEYRALLPEFPNLK